MTTRSAIDDAMLNAYIDGELDAGETAVVENALAADPALRERLHKLSAVSSMSRSVVDALAREPVPQAIRDMVEPAATTESTPRRSWPLFTPAFGAFATLIIGVLIGVNIAGTNPAQIDAALPPPWHGQAAYFHDAALAKHRARQPWDFNYSDRAAFNRHLEATMGQPVDAPDLSSFDLRVAGGRILHSNARPFPQLYYLGPDDSLVSLALQREPGPEQEPSWNNAHGRPVLGWRRNETAYALTGDVEPAQLEKISASIGASASAAAYRD